MSKMENAASEAPKTPFDMLIDQIRAVIREEIQTGHTVQATVGLITPEELANCLQVPKSWVYEQSRQGKIPTHWIGKYLRFDLHEVILSQRSK